MQESEGRRDDLRKQTSWNYNSIINNVKERFAITQSLLLLLGNSIIVLRAERVLHIRVTSLLTCVDIAEGAVVLLILA